ncbi:M23 family metallopeptidase [Brachybacterium alimentarium]|uniref:M23 family metallopeptidase n=1 Tax=Brachybacterium alimentarium TaxID=47845 RepID=UPI000DF45FBD|nr:M23 family metallopeptidase [Brachybacterium alimentarium]RCS68606.1 M23 family peptidase [Brachybacterium alimentarium]RCS72131.1 M23 family peptidase [Brachybacterium alimentarium]RCS77673.1 M23 family peptidase [Brachybacterium alimentarium]RCS86782.1 M23 family peptidase [Brachybacterium alimentarium]
MRKHRAIGGTHRDAALPAGAMKVGVLSVLATATIAAPLAAAAAGIDETATQGDTVASELPDAASEPAAAAAAPVALPVADVASSAQSATETRESGAEANRSTERASTSDDSDKAEDSEKSDGAEAESTGIEVSAPEPEPEPEPEVDAAAAEGEDAGTAAASTGGYIQPVSGPITSGFGGRVHPVLGYFKGHNGVDFGAACGTPVKASKAGEVVAVEYNSSSGNRVKVDHGDGVITGYYHLQGFNTSVGATVQQGDIVGYVGSTGRSTGCHLHFAKMDEAGTYSNPMSLLR